MLTIPEMVDGNKLQGTPVISCDGTNLCCFFSCQCSDTGAMRYPAGSPCFTVVLRLGSPGANAIVALVELCGPRGATDVADLQPPGAPPMGARWVGGTRLVRAKSTRQISSMSMQSVS